MTMNDLEKLAAYLKNNQIKAELFELDSPTPTVETAAAAVGARPDQIVKTLVFLVDGAPVAAIACGSARIDTRTIARAHDVGRKRVKLASAAEVLAITGFPAGGVPPFGHRERLPTYVDPRVLEQEVVFAGGGTDNSLIRLEPQMILEHTGGSILDLITADPPGP
jgi:Cys-tRNA(Pro) deacylase